MSPRHTKHSDQKNFIDHLAGWITWPRFLFALTLIVFLTTILFPFYWMVSSSFKTRAEISGREPVYIPSGLRLDAYEELFDPESPGPTPDPARLEACGPPRAERVRVQRRWKTQSDSSMETDTVRTVER